MAGEIMTENEFDELAFLHGPDLASWPDAVRAKAVRSQIPRPMVGPGWNNCDNWKALWRR